MSKLLIHTLAIITVFGLAAPYVHASDTSDVRILKAAVEACVNRSPSITNDDLMGCVITTYYKLGGS